METGDFPLQQCRTVVGGDMEILFLNQEANSVTIDRHCWGLESWLAERSAMMVCSHSTRLAVEAVHIRGKRETIDFLSQKFEMHFSPSISDPALYRGGEAGELDNISIILVYCPSY